MPSLAFAPASAEAPNATEIIDSDVHAENGIAVRPFASAGEVRLHQVREYRP